MNGREEYISKQETKINNFIKANSDKSYLKGFYNFVGSKKSLNTRYNYLLYVKRFMDTCSGKKLSEIGLDDYTSFLADCSESAKKPAYSALKAFSKYLKASKANTDDAMAEIEAPKYEETESTLNRREKKFLSDTEIKQYLEAVDLGVGSEKAKRRQSDWTLRDKTIIMLFLNTAFRSRELCLLDVNSIDFDNQVIRAWKKGGGYIVCPLTDHMASMLQEWLELREELLDGTEEDALFISNQKNRISYHAVRAITTKYSCNIEGKEVTPHALRATVATQVCASKGIYVAQQMLGHSTPTMTAKVYVRGQELTSRREAAEEMAKLTFA